MRAGDRVAVAVSGGADSVALLHLLLELRAELGIVPSVAHVNHKLRGAESDKDERFVAHLARQHGLDLHLQAAPVNAPAASGIEAAGRELRYGFFRQLARQGRVAKIATAHTLDDQAETVLLRIFRGTGIQGLSGIHPRIVFEDHGHAFGEVVRPLLGFRRAALIEFLRKSGQDWREDQSNRDLAFLRNRVRHRLLPLIAEEFGEAAIEHTAELAEIARAEEEHWQLGHPEIAPQLPSVAEQTKEKAGFVSGYRFSDTRGSSKSNSPSGAAARKTRQAASLPVERLLALPLAAQRRLLRAWLKANARDLSISFRLIEQALELAHGPAGKEMELPEGILRRGRSDLRLESKPFARPQETGHRQAPDYEYALVVPGAVTIPELGACVEARVVDVASVAEDGRGQLLDLGRMPNKVLIRNWRAGDRYWPAHTAKAKKVKELLSDRHATGVEKKLWPVAVAAGCGLVWMRGLTVPAAFRAPAGAAQAIWIREIAGMM
ncbi:MAG: tRNA lysidine(34) synthetase TilS [Acidobacteriia bacterium]|nr:tRNA lysidine(34) synthetase TilS [Terriglobia bacterium]